MTARDVTGFFAFSPFSSHLGAISSDLFADPHSSLPFLLFATQDPKDTLPPGESPEVEVSIREQREGAGVLVAVTVGYAKFDARPASLGLLVIDCSP